MNKEVRTRIAPSPTGPPHVGLIYMALFNRAFADSHGGRMFLRIEDTDQKRGDEHYEKEIFTALSYCGIEHDGEVVRQSSRGAIYQKEIAKMLDNGTAYYCFCTPEETARLTKEARENNENRFFCPCRDLEPTKAEKRIEIDTSLGLGEKAKPTIRLKVPKEGKIRIPDGFRGEVEFDFSEVNEQVLMKSTGLPTYHLANIVDDALFGITHVIRGEEWLNSLPKHALIYDALGYDRPVWYHMPLIKEEGGGKKLSKRNNNTSVSYYKKAGYFGEALVNYLCTLGYSLPGVEEIFSYNQFVESFDIKRVNLGGSSWDSKKLNHINKQYMLKNKKVAKKLASAFWAELFQDGLLDLAITRCETSADLMDFIAPIKQRTIQLPNLNSLETKDLDKLIYAIEEGLFGSDTLNIWSNQQEMFSRLKQVLSIGQSKFPDLYYIFTGKSSGIPLIDLLKFMGPELAKSRLINARKWWGIKLSNNKKKKLEKEIRFDTQ